MEKELRVLGSRPELDEDEVDMSDDEVIEYMKEK